MRSPDSATTRLDAYIVDMLLWAHGHQRKAIRDFVQALIDQQTGCQAQLARRFGNQEAATKRLSRLLHNERLEPRHLADAVLLQALVQLPAHGPVRLAIDWTIEAHQHLLVVSLIVGRRAVPIYWRTDDATVLKGRMQRYELAVLVSRHHFPLGSSFSYTVARPGGPPALMEGAHPLLYAGGATSRQGNDRVGLLWWHPLCPTSPEPLGGAKFAAVHAKATGHVLPGNGPALPALAGSDKHGRGHVRSPMGSKHPEHAERKEAPMSHMVSG